MTSPCITTGDRDETEEVRDDIKYRDQKRWSSAGVRQQQRKATTTTVARRSCTQQHNNSGGSSSGSYRKHKNLLVMLATVLLWCEMDDLILTRVSAAPSGGGQLIVNSNVDSIVGNCPSTCQCVADQVLCSGQRLDEAPRIFPPLSREIDLSDNDLTSVKADIFAPYNHLETLNLSGNGMTSFKTKSELLPLSLRTLDLSWNRFKKVPLIPGPLNITRLSLREGHLAFIEGFAFVAMKQLEFLDISYQKHLNGISIESFHGLKRLRELKIDACQLDTIPKIMSEGISLQNITSLSLSNHRILALEANSLLGVPSLVQLNLSYGYLERINASTFLLLEHLQVLDLRYNHLSTLSGEVFVGNFDLVDVKLSYNPWMCNCSLLDFINYKNRQQWSPLSEDCEGDDDGIEPCAMCREPYSTEGKYLVDMQQPLQSSCQMTIADSIADNCPSTCQCVADQVLCSGQELDEAPRFFPPLSREIDLSDNDLTSVKADIFAPYNHLETLNLSGNGMTSFNTKSELLPLSLRTLDLSRNRFKKVPLIPGPLNITRLSLREGRLAFIEGFAFVAMKQLEFLDISEQKHLNGISIESFHGLKRLRELNIEACQLDTIPKIMSEGISLQNITSLSLSNHCIHALEANSLFGVPSLVQLNLSYGYLERINASTFLLLEHLQVLDVRNNHLSTLSGEVFVGNFDLVDVKLSNNPWMCNCSLLDFINYKKRQQWSPLSEDCGGVDDGIERCAMCHEPYSTEGEYLVDMQQPLQRSCQMGSIPISTDPRYPCHKQQADSGGERGDAEENKTKTVTNGKLQVTAVAMKSAQTATGNKLTSVSSSLAKLIFLLVIVCFVLW